MNLENKYKLAYAKLINAKQVLVIGHTSPDPDALSSMGAILQLLQEEKVSSLAYAHDKIDALYSFIPHEEKVTSIKPGNIDEFDVIIILDCGAISRTALESELRATIEKRKENNLSRPFIIEFDHHEPQERYADLEIRLPDRASTTEIIYEFFQANKREINKVIANCILIGLMSDTGHFIHPNSSSKALAVSSQMLLYGASLQKISKYIQGESTLPSLKIWGKVLSTLKLDPKTKFACVALTEEDMQEFKVEQESASISTIFGDIVSFISYLSGVKVALLLREEKGMVKGSLRANNGNIDVAHLASLFGGGGHKRAAGFSIKGKLKETKSGWKIIR